MVRRTAVLWTELRGSWLLQDDLADTYPQQDTTADGQGLAPTRRVDVNAPPGGGVF